MESPESERAADPPEDQKAELSLEKLVAGGLVGGIALVKALDVIVGLARIAAPAVAGFVVREWLNAAARELERKQKDGDSDATEAVQPEDGGKPEMPGETEAPGAEDDAAPNDGIVGNEAGSGNESEPEEFAAIASPVTRKVLHEGIDDSPVSVAIDAAVEEMVATPEPEAAELPVELADADEPDSPFAADPAIPPLDDVDDGKNEGDCFADDDSEFDLAFDPIAIFLQGREEEEAPEIPPTDESSPPQNLQDEPLEAAMEASLANEVPVLSPADLSIDESLFADEAPFLSSTSLPTARLPRRRKRLPSGAKRPDMRLARQEPPLAPRPASVSPIHSPFLVADELEPAYSLHTLARDPAELHEEPAAPHKAKSPFLPIVLCGLLFGTAAAAAFLYLNPSLNPFRPKPRASSAPDLAEIAAPFAPATPPEPSEEAPAKADIGDPGIPIAGVTPSGSAAAPGIPVTSPDSADALAPSVSEVEPIARAQPAVEPSAEAVTDAQSIADATTPAATKGERNPTIAKDPARTLDAFLNARTIDERLRHIHRPVGIRDQLEAYEALHGPGPFAYDAVVSKGIGTVPGTSYPTHLFLVATSGQPDGIPVSVEESGAGFLVDWEAFVQFKDGYFEKFIDDPKSPPCPFYVVLRRTHYFGIDVPELDAKVCYRIASPITAGAETFAFIKKDSPVGRKAEESMSWNYTHRPVVRLEWITNESESPYIAIAEIMRPDWRGTGSETTE